MEQMLHSSNSHHWFHRLQNMANTSLDNVLGLDDKYLSHNIATRNIIGYKY
jgi:hypothetical protein